MTYYPNIICDDLIGMLGALDPVPGQLCVICDKNKKIAEGTVCDKKVCVFPSRSAVVAGVPSRYGMGKVLAKFLKFKTDKVDDNGLPIYRRGLAKDVEEIGKAKFYHFLYNPQLNWEMPPVPDMDMYGNVRRGSELQKIMGLLDKETKVFKVIIHHRNLKKWDDRYCNLEPDLNTYHGHEHGYLKAKDNDTLQTLHENRIAEIQKWAKNLTSIMTI